MAVVAAVAAFAAAGVAYGIERVLARVVDGPTTIILLMPAFGLVVNAVVRHVAGRRGGPASVEAYIDAFHGEPVELRVSAARVVGGAADVGLGVALDPAGVVMLLGSSIGETARRWFKLAGPDLLVVGAAAGLGAALQSPIAGGFLAIEVPFRDGANWRRLPLALTGSVVGFVARGIIDDFRLPFRTDIGVVGVRDILLALALAVLAGFASRLVSWLASHAQRGLSPVFGREWQQVFTGGAVLVALAAISLAAFDDVPVSLGPGPVALGWAATATSVAGLGVLIAVRAVATGASVLGRGTGGLFLPLLVLGVIAGHAVGEIFDGNVGLLGIIGAATLLGAGYRVPFAALIWLAESTHSVPAVAVGGAAVLIAHSIGGGRSVSTAQRPIRVPAPAPGSTPNSTLGSTPNRPIR